MWSWSKDKDFDSRTRLLLALLDNDRLYLDALNLALELPRYCAECDIGHGQVGTQSCVFICRVVLSH